MRLSSFRFHAFPVVVLFAAALFCGCTVSFAQNSDFNLALHANSRASAAEIGLPAYPGATLYKEPDGRSTADLGFTFGDTHFRMVIAKYITTDSPDSVLAFYRKPLSRYGEVLECNQGKPVGAPSDANSGLTCSDRNDGDSTVAGQTDSSNHHDLRAGSPHQFRIVGIDEAHSKSTLFVLVYLELPKDNDSDEKPK